MTNPFPKAPLRLGYEILIPASCIGTYQRRLLLSTLWPFALMFLAFTGCLIIEVGRRRSTSRDPWRPRAVLRSALRKTLPLVIVLTFVLLPMSANRIFR